MVLSLVPFPCFNRALAAGEHLPLGWPLASEVPSSDAEDEPIGDVLPLYFSFGSASFFAVPKERGSARALRVERFTADSFETERVAPPEGVAWNLERAWCTADGNWILWRGERDGRPILQVVSASSLKESFEIPSAAGLPEPGAPPAAVIIEDRLYLATGLELPEPLRASFHPDTAIHPNETAWIKIAWPEHAASLRHMRDNVAYALSVDPQDEPSRKAAEAVGKLLAMPPRPIVGDEIVGDWKVRSIQGSPGLHFAYPFFKARIKNLDGVFFFEKTSGSQRRSGLLHRHLPATWIFLGGATVNEEPQIGYSEFNPGGRPRESDSVGTFQQLGKDHLLMILDSTTDGDYEIYELRRP